MRIIKIICLLQLLGVLTGWQNASAQNFSIDGDTIYAHEGVEQAIQFMSDPSRIDLDSKEYNWSRSRNVVTVMPTSKATKPATLTVQEGSRLHKFIIMYSESALTPEVYNISNSKKLEEKYKDLQKRKLAAANLENIKAAEAKKRETLLSEANNDFNNGRFEQAQQKFQKIIEADPVNESIREKLKEINNKIFERDREKYYDLVALARKELILKNFDKALGYCEEAVRLKPNDNAVVIKLRDDIIKGRDDDRFQGTINNAIKAITAQNYDEAKKAYDEAKKLRPNDPQLKIINENLNRLSNKLAQDNKNKELENEYNQYILIADKAFKAEDYEAARESYTRASTLFKRSHPQEQLKLINKKLSDLATRQKSEKERLEKEQQLNANYDAFINKGNDALIKKDYSAATVAYKHASGLKPAEQYPVTKLAEIENILAEEEKEKEREKERLRIEKENEKKYNIAINKGKTFLDKNDVENAKVAYTEASSLNPAAEEPKKQLEKINIRLVEIAKQNAIDEKYNKLIHVGDSAQGVGDFHLSLKSYQQASDMKPQETFPIKQIKAVESAIQDKIRRDKESEDNKFRAARAQGNKAFKEKKWSEALRAFNEASKLKPDDEDIMKQIRIVQNQIDKDPNNIKSAPETVTETKKEEKKPERDAEKNNEQPNVPAPVIKQENIKLPAFEQQKEAFPYNIDVLKSKYPTIDFTTPPREQKYNQIDDYKEYYSVIKDMFNESPRLTIRDSTNNINLILQGISVKGTNAYIKLLIQNSSNTDFLLGPMLLSWHKKYGNTTKLYPGSIYPAIFPVIASGKEYSLVYVSRDYNISDEETLSFELGDRQKKTNLLVSIPGSVYNSEKKRLQ